MATDCQIEGSKSAKRAYHPRPIRVRPEDLSNTTGVRRLVAKIADATSRGIISPPKATAMLAAIRTYALTAETEAAERLSAQLAALQNQPTLPALVHASVVDAEFA